jgi:hypothetical protein
MTKLERRYRMLLRVLPGWYRAEREEEMVGIFLADRDDELDLEHSWPGWSETWATLALAVRTRLAANAAPARAIAVGNVVRLVAVLGLLACSAQAVGSAAVWIESVARGMVAADEPPFRTGAHMLVIGSLVALLLGRAALAKVFAVITLLPSLLGPGMSLVQPAPSWFHIAFSLPLWVAVTCLFAGFHREASAPEARSWLRAAAATGGVALVWLLIGRWVLVDLDSLQAFAVITATVVHLAFRRGSGEWTLALAVCAAAMLPYRVVVLSLTGEIGGALHTLVVAQVAGLAACCAVLLVLGPRRLPVKASPAPSSPMR